MKKLLLVLFAVVLVFGAVFNSCGEPTSTTTTVTAPAVTTTAPAVTTTAPPVTTTAPPVTTTAPPVTTTVIPFPERYGGILQIVPFQSPTTPIGYPPESDPNSVGTSSPCIEPLVKVEDNIVGVLATSWDVANDGKSITMKLRQGVKFHDGSDFNADVAKWNLDNMIAAKKLPQIMSVDIMDNYTIRLNITSFSNTILSSMQQNARMISKAYFDKNGIEAVRYHPVGTGPFVFENYERDAKLSYVRNDNYWAPGKPYLDGVVYNVIADETVRKIAFQNEQLHVLRAVGYIAQELMDAGYPYNAIPGGTSILVPDSANPDSPLANRDVRLAVSYAIDRETMAKSLGFGQANPAYQLYPGYAVSRISDLDKREYDPDKARQLLSSAGYTDGFSTDIHVFIMVVEDYVDAIADMLGKVGITVNVALDEPGLYSDYRFGGWDDGFMAHAVASGQNLNDFLVMYLGGIQFPSLKRPDGFTETLNASVTAKNIDAAKIQAVIKLIHDDVTVIPFIEETAITFFQKGVNDINALKWALALYTWTWEDAWLDPSLR